jgi:predicted P-loop ATPase
MPTESARATNGGGGRGHAMLERASLASKFPDISDSGNIKVTAANTRRAIELLGIDCRYDIFHDKLLVGGQAIGQYAGELSDHACLYLRKMIDTEFEFDPGREKMFDACVQLCLENQFDPIVDYIDSLQWDDVKRVDRWLTTYLGAEDTVLNCAVGMIMLVAMIRRARQPGCKFDQIIVLESPEGKNKSTALHVLAGGDANFSDQTILGQKDKEQQELLRGVWVYEIADLSNISKAEVESVKAFASRTHDRARPAYGRALVNLPRRCLICASTNSHNYLRSQTGNRRFWPIKVATTGPIDVEALRRDRDQLIAEAAIMEAQGASIVLPAGLWSDASQEQEQRREYDPWEDILADVVGIHADGEIRVFSEGILTAHLEIPKSGQHSGISRRLADCMRQLGWHGPKQMRIGNKSGRGFWRRA